MENVPPKPPATIDYAPAEGPGARIGPYKLLQAIGEGGMGVVYMAEQEQPVRRRVALKVIKPGMDSAHVLARFEAERQALALMDHPNIAKVLDAGITGNGRPYFVMELVKGVPLTRFCDDNKLSLRQRLELFMPVCQAIQHAHTKGIIHRDIKPSNVLVPLYDGQPVPKVIDFGVAKALHQRLTERTMFTQYGAIIGTPEYMSPEQAEVNALDIDTRSDVYSLGVLLYELLTGTTPLEKHRMREAAWSEQVRLIREEEPPSPSMRLSGSGEALVAISLQRQVEPKQLAKLVRGELDWIVMKALEKDRNRRYETANGLVRDVERYLKDEAVEACPPSVGYRLRKFARKHRAFLTTTATILLLLVVGAAVSTWQAIRATKAENLARDAETQAKLDRQETLLANQQLRDTDRELQETLYAARSNLLQVAWDTHDSTEVERLLEEQRPKAGARDLRGFEWHYWKRLLRKPLRSVKLPDLFHHYRISADGTRIVGISGFRFDTDDLQATTYDVSTGAKQNMLTVPPYAEPYNASVLMEQYANYSGDGKLLGHNDTVWDMATGKPLLKVPGMIVGLSQAGDKVAFAPHRMDKPSKEIPMVSPHYLDTVKVWQVSPKKELLTLSLSFSLGVCLVFSPQGDRLAYVAGGASPTSDSRVSPCQVVVFDLTSGAKLVEQDLIGHVQVAFSHDGKHLATAGRASAKEADTRGEVKIWEVATGKQLLHLADQADFTGGGGLAFSRDSSQIAAGSIFQGGVTVWDTATGALQFCLADQRHPRSIVFTSSDRVTVLDESGQIGVYDAAPPPSPLFRLALLKEVFPGELSFLFFPLHGEQWSRLEISPAGQTVAFVRNDSVHVLDHQGSERKILNLNFPPEVLKSPEPVYSHIGVGLSEQGNHVAVQTNFKHEGSWRTRTEVVQVNPDKQLLVAEETTALDPKKEAESVFVTLSPDGSRLARFAYQKDEALKVFNWPSSISYDVRVWSVQGPRNEWLLNSSDHLVKWVAFCPRGKFLATLGVSADRQHFQAVLWDLDRRQKLHTWPLPITRFYSPLLTFDAEAKHCALGLASEQGQLLAAWDTSIGKNLFTKTGTMQGGNNSLAFSPDGRRLVTASGGQLGLAGSITLYDLAGRRLALWHAHGGGVRRVHFSPDGHHLYSVGILALRPADLIKEWDATPVSE